MNTTDYSEMEEQHNNLISSVEFVSEPDYKRFAKDTGQIYDLVFSMEGWERRLVNQDVVSYLRNEAPAYYIMIKPLDGLDRTEDNMQNAVDTMFAGTFDSVEVIKCRPAVETQTGSAVWAGFKLVMGEEIAQTSALFVCDETGKLIACFMVPADEELQEDYQEIVDTVRIAENEMN